MNLKNYLQVIIDIIYYMNVCCYININYLIINQIKYI